MTNNTGNDNVITFVFEDEIIPVFVDQVTHTVYNTNVNVARIYFTSGLNVAIPMTKEEFDTFTDFVSARYDKLNPLVALEQYKYEQARKTRKLG